MLYVPCQDTVFSIGYNIKRHEVLTNLRCRYEILLHCRILPGKILHIVIIVSLSVSGEIKEICTFVQVKFMKYRFVI